MVTDNSKELLQHDKSIDKIASLLPSP